VCIVVSCLVCIVVSCLVCIVVILCVFVVLCVYCCFYRLKSSSNQFHVLFICKITTATGQKVVELNRFFLVWCKARFLLSGLKTY